MRHISARVDRWRHRAAAGSISAQTFARQSISNPTPGPPGVAAGSSVPSSLKAPGSAGALPRQLFVPDLIAAAPAGISSAQLAKIGKLTGVRNVLSVDGGKVTVNGRSANVLTSDMLTDIGGGPVFYSCLVEVERCGD